MTSGSSLFAQLCSTKTLLDAWVAVKVKGSAGGIDGYTVKQFEQDAGEHIREISEELRNDKWVPQPYLRVEIPKKEHEKRHLGLLTVKDKIVQQAILSLLQPRFDRLFVNNSYGYRPDKGPVKAVHRAAQNFQTLSCKMVKTYSTRTRKHLHIVAYDIANDKRRNKLAKLLEQFGQRINYSVFECMLTQTQRKELEKDILSIINTKKDQVTIYRICVDCYTKTTYFPPQSMDTGVVVVS